jgi:hypothetical protein
MNDFAIKQREKEVEKQKKKWEKSGWASGGMIIGNSVPDLTVEGNGWDNPVRHMVVVRYPWVRKRVLEDAKEAGEGEGDVVEWGVVCERCRKKAKNEEEGERRWNVRYSREGLVQHLKVCVKA